MTKVSVISFINTKEEIIKENIYSVLNQSYENFELIFIYNGILEDFNNIIDEKISGNSKIKIIINNHENNQTSEIFFNKYLKKILSEYIAIFNPYDFWEIDKLKYQVSYLDDNQKIGAVFTNTSETNSSDRISNNIENRTRHQWLNYFFNMGNILHYPSILLRKKCFENCGLYNSFLFYLSEFDNCIRLCMKYEIHVINQALVICESKYYKKQKGNKNSLRLNLEYEKILENYLQINDEDEFNQIFYDEPRICNNQLIPYYLGKYALKNINSIPHQIFGISKLNDFYSNYDLVNKYNTIIDTDFKALKNFNEKNIKLYPCNKNMDLYYFKEIIKNHEKIYELIISIMQSIKKIFFCIKRILNNFKFSFYKVKKRKNNKKFDSKPKISVHLHLFYMSLTDEFISYLKNIPIDFDLFVTVNKNNLLESDIEKIKTNFKNTKILILPKNCGRDIGAFTYFLENIDLNYYDLILKLHTKKTVYSSFEEYSNKNKLFKKSSFPITSNDLWRKHILEVILGTKEKVENIIKIFMNNNVGMIGDKAFLIGGYQSTSEEIKYFNNICDELNLVKDVIFFAGSMFWIRSDLLEIFKKKYSIESFDNDFGEIKKQGKLEHGMERIFGTLVKTQGYDIKGI